MNWFKVPVKFLTWIHMVTMPGRGQSELGVNVHSVKTSLTSSEKRRSVYSPNEKFGTGIHIIVLRRRMWLAIGIVIIVCATTEE